MIFYIVTPSYNQAEWLTGCLASVLDQAGSPNTDAPAIHVHHHIQDGISNDATLQLLQQWQNTHQNIPYYTFSFVSESDNGMYDAINRGWETAPDNADVLAHLNCDEQYLPHALSIVSNAMLKHKKADIILADMIVIESDGKYICHRRSIQPYRITSHFCCECSTAVTFQRASSFRKHKIYFDTSWKNLGDKVWYNELLKAGIRFDVCNIPVAVFALTGTNKNWTDEGHIERQRYKKIHGFKTFDKVVQKLIAARRIIRDLFCKPPLQYSIYIKGIKKTMYVDKPTGLWRKNFQ